MPLRKDVVNAFTTLGLDTDADQRTARDAYKRLALQHHPDKNPDDESAHERFQRIGHAWDVVQKYYDNPAWGDEDAFYSPFDDDDDDDSLDDDDAMDFFRFLFQQTMRGAYNRTQRRNFQRERRAYHGHGPSMFSFPGGGFMFGGGGGGFSSYYDHDQYYDHDHEPRSRNDYTPSLRTSESFSRQKEQEKGKREYEQRVRELEEEIRREKSEEARQERERKATAQYRSQARERAFAAARRGELSELKDIMDKYEINPSATSKNKTETLLLAGARSGSVPLVEWLIKQGAPVNATDKDGLNMFYIAASLGHVALAQYLLEKHPKDFHASKALPDGRTPLLLAVRSGSVDAVRVLVRFAPTHDVGKCWAEVDAALSKVESESEKKKWKAIQDVLRTKRGFVPPGDEIEREDAPTPTTEEGPGFGGGQSRKAIKKRKQREREAQEAAEAERRKIAEREERLAEQRARTEENQRKKQEHADALRREQEALIAEEERALEEAKRLSLEHAKREEERRQAEAETRRKEEDERQARLHAQRRAEQERQESVQAERQVRDKRQREAQRLQSEEQRRREEEWRLHAEQQRQREAEAEARLQALKREEEEARRRAEETKAELARLRAETVALQQPQLKPATPLSPPATPETLIHTHSTLFKAAHEPAFSDLETFQTAAETDYLFDPPGMQRPAPVFVPQRDHASPVEPEEQVYRGRGRGRGYYRGRGRGRGRGGYHYAKDRGYEENVSIPKEPASDVAVDTPVLESTDSEQDDGIERDQPSYRGRGRGRGYYRGRGRGRGRGGYHSYNPYSEEQVSDGVTSEAQTTSGAPPDVTHDDVANQDDEHVTYRGRGRGRGYFRGRGRGRERGHYHNFASENAAPHRQGDDTAEAASPTPAETPQTAVEGEISAADGAESYRGRGRGRGRGYYRGRGRGRGHSKNSGSHEDNPLNTGPVPVSWADDIPSGLPDGQVTENTVADQTSGFRGRGRGRGYWRGRGRGRGRGRAGVEHSIGTT